MKYLLLGILLAAPINAHAHAVCAGETHRGAQVTVSINTLGTMGAINGGTVEIRSEAGKTTSYSLKKEEIAQYYEEIQGREEEKAYVFLSAFAETQFPISLRYIGTNFSADPVKELSNPNRKKEPGNFMRVWKGPGHSFDDSYKFTDVVCGLWLDP